MSFADTFREERLLSRRSRARKARILGRVLAFALFLCGAALLRLDPQVRNAVDGIVVELVGKAMGAQDPAGAAHETQSADAIAGPGADPARAAGLADAAADPTAQGALPASKVRINRGTGG